MVLDTTLLLTKLHRPRLARNLVVRPHLLDRLNQGRDGYITLVCAAAGFGKTTLVSSWIDSLSISQDHEDEPTPTAWLSLDETDSDLISFVRYLLAAFRDMYPDFGSDIQELVQAQQQPQVSVFANTISNEIARLPDSFILVLDDYSAIRGQVVHDLLNALLLHWPEQMHLVLITRTNPPFPLARLRARREINEIRGKDLRFSPEEMSAYLSRSLSMPLSQSTLAMLEQHTEGWIAGLQMAALSLNTTDDPAKYLVSLSKPDADLSSYLIDEVLLQQAPAIQDFLLSTSILDRFSASLCQAVVEIDDPDWSASACLEWVEQTNLFVIPLDQQKEWYRYHHLFQNLLQQRLRSRSNNDELAALHHKAAKWFASQDLIDEAIHHFLEANELNQAARLMAQGMRILFEREDAATIERWLGLLPEDFIQTQPGLLIPKAYMAILHAQPEKVLRYRRQAETLINQESNDLQTELIASWRGQIATFYGREAYFSNQPELAVTFCQEALDNLPKNWTFARGRTMMYMGLAMQATGRSNDAKNWLLNQFENINDKKIIEAISVLVALGINHLLSGQLQQSVDTFHVVLRQTSYEKLATLRMWTLFFLAQACYHQNDLDASQQYFMEIVDHHYFALINFYHQALAGIAQVEQIRGNSARAWQIFEQLSQSDLEFRGSETHATQSLRARLWLMEDDLARAGRWADNFLTPVPDEALLWQENPHLTKAYILVHRNAPGDAQIALDILDQLLMIAERTNNTLNVIDILALKAIALDAQGKISAAQNALKKAVQLAHPGGSIRIFVDLGGRIVNLMKELARHGEIIPEIRHILAEFPAGRLLETSSKPQKIAAISYTAIIEPLTPREYDILVLLSQRQSNKEIGTKLSITISTVKRHTANLYSKLEVTRRQDAVAKAISLGILPAP